MIAFDNTEIAFAHKTDNDLRKANLLFKTMAKRTFVGAGKYFSNIAIKLHLPIKWIVKPTIYEHFVGGETIEDCEKTIRELEKYNVKVILDYSVEGEATEANINKTLDETILSIKKAAEDKNIAFAVFKPSAFAEKNILEKASLNINLTEKENITLNKFKLKIDLLCKTAFENNVSILVDAEEYASQTIVDEVVLEMMCKYNKNQATVYNTFQMYRIDRLDELKRFHKSACDDNFIIGAKFVRGAYMEKEREIAKIMSYVSPIQPDKESTDKDFNSALKFAVEHLDKISIFNGTHNEYSSNYLAKLMSENNIDNNDRRIYFSQLFGMSDNISFNLAKAGYNVAKYVPYGPVNYVLPYLIRRAEENTSVAGQTGRELNLIKTEMKRRKKSN